MRFRAALSAVLLTPFLVLTAAPADAVPADVELIPSGRYVDVVVREIRQAKTSIHLTMYLIALPIHDPHSPVRQLVEALVQAHDRGVTVDVVLDQNADWDQAPTLGSQPLVWKNQPAYRYLRARGVSAAFDDPTILTHAKVLVIDRETVILGSTNWSEAALTRNVEATALIRSPAFAKTLLAALAVRAPPPVADDPGGVPVPWAFLRSRTLLGRMVRDEGAFDLYLHCLRVFGGARETSRALDYASLARALGVLDRPEREWRKAVRKVLYRLQRKYGLLTVSLRRDQAPAVTLTALPRAVGEAPAGDEAVVRLPDAYWEWGWDRRLPLPAKIMYLLALHYAAISPMAPVWFRSQADMAVAHGFSARHARDGLMVLRRHNLLEVRPGPLKFGRYADRPANRYRLNPLYDPAALERQAAALAAQYGPAVVQRASAYAALVYEDHNVQAIEQLIELEQAYGASVVRAAARKVGAMHGNNPKRTLVYLIGVIEGIGREE